MMYHYFKFALVCIMLFFIVPASKAQTPDSLTNTIKYVDSLLFDVGFNQCDFEQFQSLLSRDWEFYDDRSGLNTSFEVEEKAFWDRCGKTEKVTRKLVETQVFPLNHYGAVQTGTHDFYVAGQRVERAQFVHLWHKDSLGWAIKRAVSYNHHPMQ